MPAGAPASVVPRSLVWATDLDVLPLDRVVERRDGYLLVRSPSNPAHYWGNLLLLDNPPRAGDAARWERLFEREFGDDPRVLHNTFAWDRVDGARGSAQQEFVMRGYELEETVGLIATPDRVRPHPRENQDVRVRPLDPARGVDEGFWEQVAELQIAGRDVREQGEETYRAFTHQRLEDLRALFRVRRGAWYVAVDRGGSQIVASCGVVVTGGRGRFQSVDTAAAYRRRGISSRLVVEATHRAATQFRAQHFVIAADPAYHALGLYQSLGFQPSERVCGAYRRPSTQHELEIQRP